MHRFCCEQEAAENLLAVFGATASGEATQVTAQIRNPAVAQVGRAPPMSPVSREGEERQHLFQLALEFLHHLRRRPPPACAESACPIPRLRLILRVPDPPELPPELAPLEPWKSRRQRFQVAEPVRQA